MRVLLQSPHTLCYLGFILRLEHVLGRRHSPYVRGLGEFYAILTLHSPVSPMQRLLVRLPRSAFLGHIMIMGFTNRNEAHVDGEVFTAAVAGSDFVSMWSIE